MNIKLLENIAQHEPGLARMTTANQQAAFNEGVVYGKWMLAKQLLAMMEDEASEDPAYDLHVYKGEVHG